MQLTKDYKRILKYFSSLNPNMYFVKGNVQSTIVGTKTGQAVLFCRYTSNQEMTEDFAIAELGSFLNILDNFNDFDIEVEKNKKVTIKNDIKTVNIVLTNPNFIQYEKNPSRFKIDEGTSYHISSSDLEELIKVAAVLKLPHIYFEGRAGDLFIGAQNCANPTSDSVSYKIGNSEKNFKSVVDKENFKIFGGSYDIVPKGKFIYLDNKDADNRLEFFIACNGEFTKS